MSQSFRTRRGARTPRRRLALCAGITLGAALAAAWWPAAPAGALTTTFLYTGAQQSFIVPAGVRSVHVLAVGGRGGNGLAPGGGLGGAPAEVSGELAIFPGQTLYVEVGGVGTDAALGIVQAFNGGTFGGEGTAGGGGASDVRLASRPEPDTPASLFSRLIVAAGGGGAGSEGTLGGAGGQAGSAGASANGGVGGGGGTEERGGASPCGGCEGKLGSGAGGSVGLAGSAGGGGGGGLFGGAGGTTNATNTGAGGGGGSSLQPDGGSTLVPALAAAPEVQISYTPPTVTSAGATPTPPSSLSSSTPSNAFSLLRPIVGIGDSITLVLELPGKGTATAVATATRAVTVKKHGKRVHEKLRFTFGASRAAVTAAGALELTISPSATGRKALASRRPLPVAIAVTFVPTGGAGSTQKLSFTLPRRSRASR